MRLTFGTICLLGTAGTYLESAQGFSATPPPPQQPLLSASSLTHPSTTTMTTNDNGREGSALHATSKSQLSAATAFALDGGYALPQEKDCKLGVLMLNLGGPETGDDVEEFLYNLFADPDIIRLPGPLTMLQGLIAYFIAKRRAPKSRAAYASIGGGSPILKYSNAQADLLSKSLQQRYGLPVNTYIGMRYWHPFTEEALDEIRKDGINALVILPLYPQFSISTSGSSLRVLQEEFSKHSSRYKDMVHTVIPSWYDRPGYVKAMADLIDIELNGFTTEQIDEAKKENPDKAPVHVLFSAHGVPKSYIDAGDPYQKQIQQCVEKISDKLYETHSKDDVQIHLSYQSRVGPIEWLRPYTDDVLPELGEDGVRNLVVVPISFVSEHIETLEEIDIEYRELAEESGVVNWRRCPALNTDETFIDDMADMVYDALIEPVQTVTEACVANNIEGVDLEPIDSAEISVTGVGGVGADAELYNINSNSSSSSSRLQQQQQNDDFPIEIGVAAVLLAFFVEKMNLFQPPTHLFGL